MGDGGTAIGDYGLISDCESAALVSHAGSIDWCCMPRLDHGSSFGRLLGAGAGHFSIAPTQPCTTERCYLDRTMVLRSVFTTDEGQASLTDLFLLPDAGSDEPGGSQLLRLLDGITGTVEFEMQFDARFDYGEVEPWIHRHDPSLYSVIGGDDGLVVFSDADVHLDGRHSLRAIVEITAGKRHRFSVRSHRPERIDRAPLETPSPDELDDATERSIGRWRRWADRLDYDAENAEQVLRSALVLKALSQRRTGAVAAAATTSLPEGLGGRGERNWDYRFSWVRDSTLAVRSLARLGYEHEADQFRGFIERSAAGNARDLQVLFGLGGERRLVEQELALPGYNGARPVRVGNQAAGQLQLDAYGMVLEQNWRWHRRGHEIDSDFWLFLVDLVDTAIERWSEPDAGFWEMRHKQHFTSSKAMCWVAVDRGLRLAAEIGLKVTDEGRWREAREEIREAVDSRGVDADRGVFVRDFESNALDAALLRLPIVGYCDWQDERMIRTAEAIDEDLEIGGLLRRYVAADGFDVEEGAFLACSFWLAECYARQGRRDRAEACFHRTIATANELGLLSEEFDPLEDRMLGNFPQALSHLSHLEAAIALAEVKES
jgi:GH15 family glucan-1,4-alpha-glucosidase